MEITMDHEILWTKRCYVQDTMTKCLEEYLAYNRGLINVSNSFPLTLTILALKLLKSLSWGLELTGLGWGLESHARVGVGIIAVAQLRSTCVLQSMFEVFLRRQINVCNRGSPSPSNPNPRGTARTIASWPKPNVEAEYKLNPVRKSLTEVYEWGSRAGSLLGPASLV